jgi:hypothetical protein
LEALCFDRKKVFDVCAARENALEINPLTLDVDPDIEEYMYTIKSFFPNCGIFLENWVNAVSAHSQRAHVTHFSPL